MFLVFNKKLPKRENSMGNMQDCGQHVFPLSAFDYASEMTVYLSLNKDSFHSMCKTVKWTPYSRGGHRFTICSHVRGMLSAPPALLLDSMFKI